MGDQTTVENLHKEPVAATRPGTLFLGTATDVAQRLGAIHEDSYTPYPDEALANACLLIYRRERELGTEMIAIIGLLEEYVEEERHRRYRESEQQRREQIAVEKALTGERLLSVADCRRGQLDDRTCSSAGQTAACIR